MKVKWERGQSKLGDGLAESAMRLVHLSLEVFWPIIVFSMAGGSKLLEVALYSALYDKKVYMLTKRGGASSRWRWQLG